MQIHDLCIAEIKISARIFMRKYSYMLGVATSNLITEFCPGKRTHLKQCFKGHSKVLDIPAAELSL
jgi:hypothetical protein